MAQPGGHGFFFFLLFFFFALSFFSSFFFSLFCCCPSLSLSPLCAVLFLCSLTFSFFSSLGIGDGSEGTEFCLVVRGRGRDGWDEGKEGLAGSGM